MLRFLFGDDEIDAYHSKMIQIEVVPKDVHIIIHNIQFVGGCLYMMNVESSIVYFQESKWQVGST